MAETTSLLTKKVLLLDEGLYLSYSLKPHLRPDAYTILRAATAPEAQTLIQGERPQLLIVNLRGARASYDLAVLKEIRARQPSLPIILMAPREMESLAQELGAHAFIRQPFSLLALVEVAREVLGATPPSPRPGTVLGPAAEIAKPAAPLTRRNVEDAPARAAPTAFSPPAQATSPPPRQAPTAAPRPAVARESRRASAGTPVQAPTLSSVRLEAATQVIAKLRSDIGARCILLADILGNLVTAVGIVDQRLNTKTLLSLLAGSYATILEMSRHIGEERLFNLNYHEGERFDIYSSNLGRDYLLAIIADRSAKADPTSRALGPRPMGMVWLYTRRVLPELLRILTQPEAGSNPQALDEDFGAQLRSELEELFATDLQTPPQPGGEPSAPGSPRGREQELIPPDLLAELDPPDAEPPPEKGHAS